MFHPAGFIKLARMIKERTDKNIWCYTGYRFEDLLSHPLRRELVELCDVIVDGRYIEAERDLSLRFRGSRNQRIIDVKKSLQQGTICLFELP
jgi:anaerobic ribonucleoside-triphosphate reductase activating protein